MAGRHRGFEALQRVIRPAGQGCQTGLLQALLACFTAQLHEHPPGALGLAAGGGTLRVLLQRLELLQVTLTQGKPHLRQRCLSMAGRDTLQPCQGVTSQLVTVDGFGGTYLCQQPLGLLGAIGRDLGMAPDRQQCREQKKRGLRMADYPASLRRRPAAQRKARHSTMANSTTLAAARNASSTGCAERWNHNSSHQGSLPT